jgi:DNA-binding Xre family transcriptional regulator
MKYIDALRKYNENKDKWCMPRKGSVDYLEIRDIMKATAKTAKTAKTSSLSPLSRIKLELLNVSGRNNNCFFNSVYMLLKETSDGGKWKSGSYLRRFLTASFLEKAEITRTVRRFLMYLELVQMYIKDGMGSEEIAELLAVNAVEIRSLRKGNIKRVDLTNQEGIEKLLDRHFKVLGRMPSQPEMSLTINYFKNKYDIVVLSIIIDDARKRDKLLEEVRNKINEKLESAIKSSGSSRLSNNIKKYRFGIIITDNTHYQLLKINNKVLSTIGEIKRFIASQNTSFSFRRTNVASRSSS